jgi:hypothetical protein
LDIVHAIGHTLGLKHTPAAAEGLQNSVMRTGDVNTIDLPNHISGSYIFPSLYDVNKVSTLYAVNRNSAIVPYIIGPDTFGANTFVAYNVSYISSEANVNYTWKVLGVNGTNYTLEFPPSSEFGLYDFTLLKGNYQIRCTVSGGKYITPVTVTKNLIVL